MKTVDVIGGGVAGMAAAQVLARHFDRVRLFTGDVPAQGYHLHVLLQAGQMILQEIFPGIIEELEKTCPRIDWAQDTVWENAAGVFPRYDSQVKTLAMSRLKLHEEMRQHLKNVEIIPGRVQDLQELSGGLVVLAAGQNFPLKRFLGEAVEEESYAVNLTYRSVLFARKDVQLPSGQQYYFQVDPPFTQSGGVLSPIEDGKMVVTLIDHEESMSGCHDFKRKASIKIQAMIKDAQPLSDIKTFRKTTCYRRKLRLEKMPSQVIVMGDCLQSLNPVFGQGMTVALKQAQLLARMLDEERFSAEKFNRSCHLLGRVPFFFSKQGTLGRFRQYLKLCQQSPALHHYFLKQLHNVELLP